MATRKCFNISLLSREIYEGYQIFILRQQPSVKALINFCFRKAVGQGVGKEQGMVKKETKTCNGVFI